MDEGLVQWKGSEKGDDTRCEVRMKEGKQWSTKGIDDGTSNVLTVCQQQAERYRAKIAYLQGTENYHGRLVVGMTAKKC